MKNSQIIQAWDIISPGKADQDRMLHSIIRQSGNPRPRLQPRRILILTLIVISVLGVTAFALNESGRVNWFGEKVIDDLPQLAVAEEELSIIQMRAQKAKAMMKSAPEEALWVAEIWDQTQIFHSPTRAFDSAEALAEQLRLNNLSFPSSPPSGFAFHSGSIDYYLSENTLRNGILLLGEEQPEEGIRLKKYRITTDYESDIGSWTAIYQDSEGSILSMSCLRDSESTLFSFNISASGEQDLVSIPGMSQAIYIHNSDNRYEHSLNFLQTGLPSILAYHWYNPSFESSLNPDENNSLVYCFESNTLAKDALLKIASSLK